MVGFEVQIAWEESKYLAFQGAHIKRAQESMITKGGL